MRAKQVNEMLSSSISPYRILVAAIFERAIKDSKKLSKYTQNAKNFLESDYANELLQLARLDDFIQ